MTRHHISASGGAEWSRGRDIW